jgi:hypothetical protein
MKLIEGIKFFRNRRHLEGWQDCDVALDDIELLPEDCRDRLIAEVVPSGSGEPDRREDNDLDNTGKRLKVNP